MSSIQAGLVAGNAQNEAGGSVPRNRSRFPLSESFFTTERFADYNPCFVMEGVSGDKITLNQPHQVRTYSLKAPLLQNILKKKDYFMVPMQAILPLNWEKFYTNPVIGDDVPLGVGTGVPNFWGRLIRVFDSDETALETALAPASTETDIQKLTRVFKFLIFYEMFYSNGSLLKNLRIGGNAYCPLARIVSQGSGSTAVTRDSDFDELFDVCIRTLFTVSASHRINRFDITIGSKSYRVENQLTDAIGSVYVGANPLISLREVLELLRDDLNFTITNVDVVGTPFDNLYPQLQYFSAYPNNIPIAPASNPDFKSQGIPLNLARLCAYQIVCAHYYSNDHIDVLYSAELYRQYMRSLFMTSFSSSQLPSTANSFLYNGVRYEFDALSAYTFNLIICDNASFFNGSFKSVFSLPAANLAYIVSLFGFKKSLRFMDYFTGSRSRPLAIGDANVDTSGSQVGVLDIARKFQATRFYNAVNRSGRKFSSYMKELFGIVPKPDYHNPFYLAHTSDVVGSDEVQNTGAAQLTADNSITAILRSNAARYAFSFEPDRDCIIIGISYYDLPRVYTKATERQNFYLDRMDMFNPFMQYIGDQPIFNAEIGSPVPDLQPFSYTNRDMEYKQRFNMCAGGFSVRGSQLDKWFFPADVLRRWFGTNIGSSFIRSFNSEFDRFYISLNGFSLGNYWHFIVRYDDRCDASRPMAYAPGILQ